MDDRFSRELGTATRLVVDGVFFRVLFFSKKGIGILIAMISVGIFVGYKVGFSVASPPEPVAQPAEAPYLFWAFYFVVTCLMLLAVYSKDRLGHLLASAAMWFFAILVFYHFLMNALRIAGDAPVNATALRKMLINVVPVIIYFIGTKYWPVPQQPVARVSEMAHFPGAARTARQRAIPIARTN